MDQFTQAYIECALWSSTDGSDQGVPLDQTHDASNIAPETLAKMQADCAEFQSRMAKYITDSARAGHDFWLTRNGHGAGFWDGDWSEPAATILTEESERFGGFDLYIGDDRQIHA